MSQNNPLLSIIITSYTMERFKDICDLLDSIKSQTLLNPTQQTQETQQTIEVIFVAERSRELYNKVKQFVSQQSVVERGVVSSQDLQTADFQNYL